jgi:hypothetical protein
LVTPPPLDVAVGGDDGDPTLVAPAAGGGGGSGGSDDGRSALGSVAASDHAVGRRMAQRYLYFGASLREALATPAATVNIPMVELLPPSAKETPDSTRAPIPANTKAPHQRSHYNALPALALHFLDLICLMVVHGSC